jgi:hypothetical protein
MTCMGSTEVHTRTQTVKLCKLIQFSLVWFSLLFIHFNQTYDAGYVNFNQSQFIPN